MGGERIYTDFTVVYIEFTTGLPVPRKGHSRFVS
jgi:hypothetical protein